MFAVGCDVSVFVSKQWSQRASYMTIISSEYVAQTGPSKLTSVAELLFFFLLNSDKCCLISIRMNFCSSDKGLLSYWDCLNPATGSFVNSITPCNGLNKYSAWVLVEKEIFWRKVEVKDRKQWWNFKDAFNSLYTFMHIYTAFRKYIQSNIH